MILPQQLENALKQLHAKDSSMLSSRTLLNLFNFKIHLHLYEIRYSLLGGIQSSEKYRLEIKYNNQRFTHLTTETYSISELVNKKYIKFKYGSQSGPPFEFVNQEQ